MARWFLKDAHYLSVAGIEWEYKETNRETGRQARKVYEVPQYLNPKDASDWNYPRDEMIIVSDRYDPAHPRDIVFRGPPTPDMEPLDDEAREITQGYIDRGAWVHPIESLNMTYSQSVLSEFERSIAEIVAKQMPHGPAPALSLGGVSPGDFAKLQAQVATLMERNAQLEEAMVKKPARRL
jgi:hypothetical protein